MECAIYRGKILNGVGKNFNWVLFVAGKRKINAFELEAWIN